MIYGTHHDGADASIVQIKTEGGAQQWIAGEMWDPETRDFYTVTGRRAFRAPKGFRWEGFIFPEEGGPRLDQMLVVVEGFEEVLLAADGGEDQGGAS